MNKRFSAECDDKIVFCVVCDKLYCRGCKHCYCNRPNNERRENYDEKNIRQGDVLEEDEE